MPDSASATVTTGETPRWRLQLCGQPRAVSAQGDCVFLERRDAAMLALLAIDGTLARNRVIAQLWPDEAPQQTRGRLRQRLYALKRKLGAEAVEGSAQLALAPTLAWPGFDHEPADAALLGDDDHADLPEFARWLAAARIRLQGLRRERLASQASSLEQQGRMAEAIVAAEGLLALEPWQEHAHRRLMRLHYLRGDRAAALLAFDRCEQVLKNEVGAKPSSETLGLLAQVEGARMPAAPAAWRLVPATVLRPPRLIGRDAEWARLQAAWAQHQAIVVLGEAGMGKTRLVGDIVLACAAEPGRVLQVSARPGDERVPYAVLSRLLRGLLALRKTPLAEGVQAELARLLPELPQSGATGRSAGAQARLAGAVETTLQQAVDAGLEAVLLDDLHFADPGSLEMARHLTGMAGVRWLAACRGAEIGAAGRQLVDTLATTHDAVSIELQPLASGQVEELIRSLGIDGLDAPALSRALHRRTGGNPLFLLETLKALLLQGDGRDALASDARALALLPASGNIGPLIGRRLAGLTPAALKLMQCAALAGQDFSVDLAMQLLGVRAIDLAAPWDELESAQVIRDGAFAHDLVHEAALASVPRSIARRLHGEVAEWMQSQACEPARVAHHWQHAGNPARAGPAWLAAARRCGEHGRRTEQSQLLERAAMAFEQASDPKARCHALLMRAQVIGEHSDLASGQRALADAAAAVVDDEDRLRLAVIGVSVRTFHGEDDYALAHAPAALVLARRLGRPEEALLVSRPYSGALARAGRADESLQLLADQRDWVEAHAVAEQRQEYWNALAIALDHAGRMREAMQAWQTTRAWAEQGGSDLLCQVIGNMAYTSAKMGDVQRAAALGEQALALARSVGDGFDQQQLEQQLALGHHLCNLGRYGEAVPLLECAAAGFREGGRDLKADTATHFLALVWVHLGQHARALRLTSGAAGSPLARVQAMRLAYRALALHAAGQDALETVREALACLNVPESLWYRTHSLIATAIVAPDEGEPMALELASWALARERFGLALAAHARAARCALAMGAAERARPHLHTALQLAQAHQPDVYYLPELWWMAARVHQALGRDAARQAAVRDGARWVARVAAQHVPPVFRDSFLHRNRINAELLQWAREMGGEA